MGWSTIIFETDKNVDSNPHAEYNILVTNVYPGNFNFRTNITIRHMLIAPSKV